MKRNAVVASMLSMVLAMMVLLGGCAASDGESAEVKAEPEEAESTDVVVTVDEGDEALMEVEEEEAGLEEEQDAADPRNNPDLNWESPLIIDTEAAEGLSREAQVENGIFDVGTVAWMGEDNTNKLAKIMDGKVVKATGYVGNIDDSMFELQMRPHYPLSGGIRVSMLPDELAELETDQMITVIGIMNVKGEVVLADGSLHIQYSGKPSPIITYVEVVE